GQCLEFAGNLPAAETAYRKSIERAPASIPSYVRRAALLRGVTDPVQAAETKANILADGWLEKLKERLDRGQIKKEQFDSQQARRQVDLAVEADALIDDLVEKNPKVVRAHLMAAAYWR